MAIMAHRLVTTSLKGGSLACAPRFATAGHRSNLLNVARIPSAVAERCIIHIDMDAFFASVEQRDKPELRGQPVVVGGQPQSRGVVAAASYEARAFGVRSAMSCAQAYRLCPQAVFLKPRFHRYRAVSDQIMEIFDRYTPVIEPISLDEAYLDLTGLVGTLQDGIEVARKIKTEIRSSTKLSASAGVAPNKFLAKLASDMQKPDGLTLLDQSFVRDTLPTLPVRKLPWVGPKTEERLASLRILSVGDLARYSSTELERILGSTGSWLHALAHGIDSREVDGSGERKSLGVEDTFSRDLFERRELEFELSKLVLTLTERLLKQGLKGRTIGLKITFSDFKKISRQVTLHERTNDPGQLLAAVQELLSAAPLAGRAVRLLGVSASGFSDPEERQLRLGI